MAASTPSGMRDRIFISYRRDDARGASGRVWDWLRIGFGRERIFRDVASIGAGKWREKIDQALAASTACVAVIGRRWADDTNLPRLQDPTDMVRYELETALAGGERQELTVVPLLVEEAKLQAIPTAELPDSLQPLLGEWNVLERQHPLLESTGGGLDQSATTRKHHRAEYVADARLIGGRGVIFLTVTEPPQEFNMAIVRSEVPPWMGYNILTRDPGSLV
jgi:hypothetical protein